MANEGIRYLEGQPLELEMERQELNRFESSVRNCAFFFLSSGTSIMVFGIGVPAASWVHIFVGFLLFILGTILWLLQAFLICRSPAAVTVAALVVGVVRRLFLARD